MNNQLLTVEEVAARLKCQPSTVREYVRSRRLRAVRFGRTSPLRFRAIDVERFIESSLTTGGRE